MKILDQYINRLRTNIQKDLYKLKDALSEESGETKDMILTYLRFGQGKATLKEMKAANSQFRSFVKTLGLGALAVLPFAPITIPIIVKIGRKLGIDIIPNSFKKNFEESSKEDK